MFLRSPFPRRSFRRQIGLLVVLCLTILFASSVRNALFGPYHNTNITFRTFVEPITVIRANAHWGDHFEDGDAPKLPKLAIAGQNTRVAPAAVGGRNPSPQSAAPVQEHTYLDNGLLQVNSNGPHPIPQLISRAEAEWEAKISRSSKNLRDAVTEYKRRYKRLPPKGFDAWWAFVKQHNVQLPDEYDQIYRDLEPFWGVDPRTLQSIQREWEGHADSFTLGKDAMSDPISLLNFSLPQGAAYMTDGGLKIIEMLQDVQKFIPPFRAVFSPHDNPNLLSDYELRQVAIDAASRGETITFPVPGVLSKVDGWLSACGPDSPARTEDIDLSRPPPASFPLHGKRQRKPKTFIYDQSIASDPCMNPSILQSHGQFLSHKFGPMPHGHLIPQFSYSPTRMHTDITPAVPHSWVDEVVEDTLWDRKVEARLQWRGSNTGMWHADGPWEEMFWKESQRIRMMDWATSAWESNITILPPSPEGTAVGEGEQVPKARYAPSMLDVAFAGYPVNCEKPMCEKLDAMYEFRRGHSWREEGKYKYILDVDGNGWSSRFKRLMTTHALIFKSTIYVEWFNDRVQPWVHYIPVQNDFSDLWDSLVYFRGDLAGNGAHEEEAKKIALTGREWSLKYWRKVDLAAYMFRMFLEYARVMSVDRDKMVYDYTEAVSMPQRAKQRPMGRRSEGE